MKLIGKRPSLCRLCHQQLGFLIVLLFSLVVLFQSHCLPSMDIHSNFCTIYSFYLLQIVKILAYAVLKLCIVFMWKCLLFNITKQYFYEVHAIYFYILLLCILFLRSILSAVFLLDNISLYIYTYTRYHL